jgi:hypothetical protein
MQLFLTKVFRSPIVYLNLVLVLIYTIASLLLDIQVSDEFMFHTPDSKTYLDVTHWIMGNVDADEITRSISIRPILYPIIIFLTWGIGGVKLLWIVQILLWLGTINLIYLGLYDLTKRVWIALIPALLIASNLTLIAFTYYGLTEVSSAFLISVLVYFLIRNRSNYFKPKFFVQLVLILVLLTIIKPVFLIPFYFAIFILFPVFYFKSFWKEKKRFFHLLLVVIPIVLQMCIVKVNANEFKVSTISSITVRDYFFAQGLALKKDLSRDEALIGARAMSPNERTAYIQENKKEYLTVFLKNVKYNYYADPLYLYYPDPYAPSGNIEFMRHWNKFSFKLHFLFMMLSLVLLVLLWIKKDKSNFLLILSLSGLILYLVVTTGVTCWQSDRLLIFSTPVWMTLYPYILFIFAAQIKAKKSL